MDLREQLGNIDIYLVDQLLKGRLVPGMSLLDAGCGGGRNLVWFLRRGYEVFGADESPEAVEQVRRLAAVLAPHLPPESFQVADLADLPFPDARFDAVLCSAVLHFARDEAHFDRMLDELWRVLRPGGLFFARLASTIGMEGRVQPLGSHWYQVPDGSRRFLADEAMLRTTTHRLGGTWLDPLKTTLVEDLRAMTTWVLRKPR
ncbi:MAG TPA: class I SAM-dependent methyltransferase [Thermoanaerobaculia bacterium]|nr:class I SAM-dependent methyltransferase [Thermoanaerobaculia bacterium]